MFIKEKGKGKRKKRKGKENTSPFALSKGFTLLELLITLAVIGIVIAVASSPEMDLANTKKSFINSTNNLQGELSTLRNEAMTRSTTSRMVITETGGGIYTLTTYYSSAPTSTCTAAGGTWTTLVTRSFSIGALYQLTGAPMTNTCFYRDGTSSGGAFVLSPITPTTGLQTATITLTIATGYLDVDVQ